MRAFSSLIIIKTAPLIANRFSTVTAIRFIANICWPVDTQTKLKRKERRKKKRARGMSTLVIWKMASESECEKNRTATVKATENEDQNWNDRWNLCSLYIYFVGAIEIGRRTKTIRIYFIEWNCLGNTRYLYEYTTYIYLHIYCVHNCCSLGDFKSFRNGNKTN